MSINPLAFVAFTFAFVPGAIAGDTAKPALPTKTSSAFELKNKSSFVVPDGIRSPFKPIGWKGGAVAPPVGSSRKRILTTAPHFASQVFWWEPVPCGNQWALLRRGTDDSHAESEYQGQ
jgi:hypothetical protein